MIRGRFALVLLLASCSTMPPAPALAAPPDEPLERFSYTAEIGSVPPGASEVVVSLEVPETSGASSLRIVDVRGLVGNSMFASAPPATEGTPADAVEEPVGNATVAWGTRDAEGARVRTLSVRTAGKPLELTLGIARTAGAPLDATALEADLARRIHAAADGVALDGLQLRLRRVN